MNQSAFVLTVQKIFRNTAATSILLLFLTPTAYSQEMAIPVETDLVKNVPFNETVAIFGQIISQQSGTVAATISAPVATVDVSVGDRVEQGDLVASLDTSTLDLERNVVESRANVAIRRVQRAQTEVDLKKQQEKRLALLRHSAATTEAQHEDAVLLLRAAEDARAEAQASHQLSLNELASAEHRVSLTQIKAPYAGVVVEKFIEVGEYARIGDRVIRLVSDSDLEIEAYIPYRYIDSFQVDDKIMAKLDNGTEFEATVRAFIPEEHAQTRTRAVRLSFDVPSINDALAINQNVTIDIPTSRQRESLSVHKDAVMISPDGHLVYVVEDGVANPKNIIIGDAVGNRFEVISGLADGESVVTRGNERLQPGQKVRSES